MALSTIFANQAEGNVPAVDLDTNFNEVSAMAVLQCTAVGTNTITLTQAANQPAIAAYENYQIISFVPAATPTGAVTLNLNGIGAENLYYSDGVTQASANSFTDNQVVVAVYNSALNSSNGGFQICGMINLSPGQYPGTATNDNASTGNIGEYLISTVSAVSAVGLATATPKNITQIALTAGDWDVEGTGWFAPAGTTTSTFAAAAVNTTSGTLPTNGVPGLCQVFAINSTQAASQVLPTGLIRISAASATTAYLVGQMNFAVSSCNAYGSIRARRVR